jgi:hypothetical protein
MKSIAILGTGPAGLMAAQAVALKGRPFAIFGMPDMQGRIQRSVISGAQFIHTPVPTVNDTEPDFELTYRKLGTSAGYQHKVYGGDDVPFVSFDRVVDGETIPAWSLRKTYDRMFDGICGADGHSVNPMNITPLVIREWLALGTWDLIISTIPRHAICLPYNGYGDRPHAFHSQSIVVNNDSMNAKDNTIVYNGDEEFSWYRSSRIDGVGSTEWGGQVQDQIRKMYKDLAVIKKPIRHECDCWLNAPIVFAGRYGEWRKGVLTHEAFITAFRAMEEL